MMQRNGKLKICPECEVTFSRTKRKRVRILGVEGVHANICPKCDIELFYKRANGHVDVLLMEDKILVDLIVEKINRNLQELSNFKMELGEATSRERKFAYALIPWTIDFLNGAEIDLGLSVHVFLLGFFDDLLEDGWWKLHLESLLQISNMKSRLIKKYWEKTARDRGISTSRSVAAAEIRERLDEQKQAIFIEKMLRE